jgi:hypothetical protein
MGSERIFLGLWNSYNGTGTKNLELGIVESTDSRDIYIYIYRATL